MIISRKKFNENLHKDMTLRNYKGKTFKKLIKFKIIELYDLLDSRRKRKISRYAARLKLKHKYRLNEQNFISKFKNIITSKINTKILKTHIRNFIIFPVFVNKKFLIYSGKAFLKTDIKVITSENILQLTPKSNTGHLELELRILQGLFLLNNFWSLFKNLIYIYIMEIGLLFLISKKIIRYINLKTLILIPNNYFPVFLCSLLKYNLQKIFIFFKFCILYNIFKIITNDQNIIYICFLNKVNNIVNTLTIINLHIISYTQTLKAALLYKKISFNDKTISRIIYIKNNIKLIQSNISVFQNNKNLKNHGNLHISYVGECLLFFLNHRLIFNGFFQNKFRFNHIFLKNSIKNTSVVNYAIIYIDIIKLQYCYNGFYLVSFLSNRYSKQEQNIYRLKTRAGICNFLIQNYSNQYIPYSGKYRYQPKHNFIKKTFNEKISNIQNNTTLNNLDNLKLLIENSLSIKRKKAKKSKKANFSWTSNGVIIENVFRNLMLQSINLFDNNKKKNYYIEKLFILKIISEFTSSNMDFLLHYLNFFKKKKKLTTEVNNLLLNPKRTSLKRKTLKNYQREKNTKKKHNLFKKDVRNFFYLIQKKRWTNLVLCSSLINKPVFQNDTTKQIMIHSDDPERGKSYSKYKKKKLQKTPYNYLKNYCTDILLFYIKQKTMLYLNNLI